MKKLKIGLVFDDSLDKPDGVQQYVLILGRWLAREGHDVHYLVGETKRSDLPNLNSLSRNVKVKFNQNRMAIPLPANSRRIRELLQKEQFDVLHVQVPYSPALAGQVIKAAGPKTAVIGTFHILPYSKLVVLGNRLLGLWVQGTLRRFDAMMASTDPTREFAKKTFKVDSQLVPLPLELDAFYTAKPFPKYKNDKTVVFLGRLVERKGCQYLLRAVYYAVHKGTWPKDARVVVCGGGPLDAKLKKYARDHKIDHLVDFEGFISEADKPRYLASADVVAYPSPGGESFGVVLIEALAATPGIILAGNNPGYASVLAARPESLFDPHDIPGFAEKLVEALTNKQLRDETNKWQRSYVHTFDAAVVGKQIVSIYNQALHKRRA